MSIVEKWTHAHKEILSNEKLGDGEKSATKDITQHGKGPKPTIGSVVKVHYVAKLSNGQVFDSSLERKEPLVFELGKKMVIPVMDLTVATMKEGEHCIVSCGPTLGYQATGSPPKVPPNESLTIEVELISFDRKIKHILDMTVDERIETATQLREEGNQLFKAAEYAKADERYKKVLEILAKLEDATLEQETVANDLKFNAGLNLSATHLKLENYVEAAKFCDAILKEDPDNVKALFRRGQACVGKCEFDAAKKDYLAAQKLSPSDKAIAQALKQLPVQIQEYERAQKEVYKNIFKA